MSIGVWMFLFVILIPMQVSAESRDSLKVDEQGNVTLVSEYAAREGISSLSFSFSVDSVNGEKIEFQFNDSSAKVSEFRYNEDEKKLNIYMAGTEALFTGNTDSLAVGKIVVKDKNGSDTSASVSVVADSLQYVYGTELKTAEDPELPGVVQIGNSSLPVPTPGSQGGSMGQEDSGNDDDSDDENSGTDEDAAGTGNSTDKPGGNTAGTGSSSNKPGGNAGGTGSSSNKPGGTAGATGSGTNKPSGNTSGTETGTDKPGTDAGGSDNSSQSTDNALQETGEGNQDAEPVIGGSNIQQRSSGFGWIPVVAVIGVVIAAAVIAMTVVVLKKRPEDHES